MRSRIVGAIVVAAACAVPATAQAGLLRDVVATTVAETAQIGLGPLQTCTESDDGSTFRRTCRTPVGPVALVCDHESWSFGQNGDGRNECRIEGSPGAALLGCRTHQRFSGYGMDREGTCFVKAGALGVECVDRRSDDLGGMREEQHCTVTGTGAPIVIPLPKGL